MRELVPEHIELDCVDIWQQDETRVGQQGSKVRIWAPTGSRTRKVKQQQFLATYIYGAACGTTGESFGLVIPCVDTQGMNIFLSALSKEVKEGRYMALIVDNAGWHIAKDLAIPSNITLIPLPSYSPELNAMEQVWEWLKYRFLANRCFKSYEEIVDACSEAWNNFSSCTETVQSICFRKWHTAPH